MGCWGGEEGFHLWGREWDGGCSRQSVCHQKTQPEELAFVWSVSQTQLGRASHWCWTLREELGLEKAPGPVLPCNRDRRKGFREQLSRVPPKQPGFLLSLGKAGLEPSHLCPYPSTSGKQQLWLYVAFPLFSTNTQAGGFSPWSQNLARSLPHSHPSPPGQPPRVPPCQRPHAEPASVPTLSSC